MASCCCCCRCSEVDDGDAEDDVDGEGDDDEESLRGGGPRQSASLAEGDDRTDGELADEAATLRDLSEPADADVGNRFGFGLAFPLEDREWACLEYRG